MKFVDRAIAILASRKRDVGTLDDRLVLPFELGADGKAPTEFCIFKGGDNTSEKGTFVFDSDSQGLVMGKYAQRGVPMMMDYEHQSQVEPPIEAPASAKSFVPQVRNGELWATDIVWTDRARQYLESGEYRLFSPAFSYKKLPDGRMRVTKLINVALTNNPALHNIEPLMAAKDDDMNEEEAKKLKAENERLTAELAALKSKFDGVEAKLTTALAAKKKEDDEPDEDDAEATANASLRDEVVKLTGKKDLREAVGVLRSTQLKAGQAEEANARLKDIEAGTRDAEFTALLKQGFEDGKISKAQREAFWEKKCRGEDKHVTVEGLAMLKDFLPTAPVQVTLKETAQREGKGRSYSKDEHSVMLRMGINPSDAEQLKAFEDFQAAQQ